MSQYTKKEKELIDKYFKYNSVVNIGLIALKQLLIEKGILTDAEIKKRTHDLWAETSAETLEKINLGDS